MPAFILPQSHFSLWNNTSQWATLWVALVWLPEIRSKGKCLCCFARSCQSPLHGVIPFCTTPCSRWECPCSHRLTKSVSSHLDFANLVGEQWYLSLSFNLYYSYFEWKQSFVFWNPVYTYFLCPFFYWIMVLFPLDSQEFFIY